MSSIPSPGTINLENVLNLRDVGVFTNAVSGKHRLNTGLLFRSARPDFASPSDRDTLQSGLNIRTILDLRSKTEQLKVAQSPSSLPVPPTTDTTSPLPPPQPSPPSPLPIPTTKINLNGPLFQLRLISLLPVFSALHLILLYTLGYRIPAIRILSVAMSPRGLTGLAIDTLLSSWYEMRSIFALLADKSHWPVLVHCTQGKDRTGLTVLLLELLCGVDEEACERDYTATQGRLESEREGRVREIEEIGLPAEWADCEPGWVGRVKGFIDGRWGGVGGYLFWCGVKREEVVAVKEILMASPA